MLSALLLLTNMASAQVTCTPAGNAQKAKNVAVCGAERTLTYTKKNQKLESITLLFKDTKQGIERPVMIKNPGLMVDRLDNATIGKNEAVKKELAQIKKEWKLKDVKFEVSNFTVAESTPLYTTADLKTKAVFDAKKIDRAVASEAPITAGGVRVAPSSGGK